MRKRIIGVAVAALLTAAPLTSCGGGGTSENSSPYCQDLRSAKASVRDLQLNRITQQRFDQLVDELHTVRDEAPKDVRAAWATFSVAVDEFQTRLRESGYTMDDMAKMNEGTMASGPAMDKAMAAARSLGTIAVSNALSSITREASKLCGVNLNP